MFSFINLLTCCLFLGGSLEAARILAVFPVPSISHQVVFRPITQELARRGHEVIVVTPNPAFPKGKAPKNLTEIDVHDISYKQWDEKFMKKAKDAAHDLKENMRLIIEAFAHVFDSQLQDRDVQKLINDKNQKFDLLLLEACVRPALIFSHIFDAPVIQVSSLAGVFDNYDVMGAPTHPLLYPNVLHKRLYGLSFVEKITELYEHYAMNKIFDHNEVLENQVVRKHLGPETPAVSTLNEKVHMLFLNIHPMFDSLRPVPPTVIYMGGLHQNPQKELPTDLKKFLDSADKGVIYMSLGTNVDPTMLSPEKINILVKVFSQMPYNVLLKWHSDVLPGKTDNVRIGKWWPQSDLLRHPNIKLFITQGGIQSTDEAITAGVPLVAIPMIADQWHNAEKYVHFKIGMKLEMSTLTEEELKGAINTVIGDESYRQNIIKLRSRMQDQPQKPLERATWWIEHVLRHGGAGHLRAPAANMSWEEYYEIDFVLTILGCLSVAAAILLVGLWWTYSFVMGISGKKIKDD